MNNKLKFILISIVTSFAVVFLLKKLLEYLGEYNSTSFLFGILSVTIYQMTFKFLERRFLND